MRYNNAKKKLKEYKNILPKFKPVNKEVDKVNKYEISNIEKVIIKENRSILKDKNNYCQNIITDINIEILLKNDEKILLSYENLNIER